MIAIDIEMPRACGDCPFLADFVDSMDDVPTYCELEYISHDEAAKQAYLDYDAMPPEPHSHKKGTWPKERPKNCGLKTLADLTPADLERPSRILVQHYKRRVMGDAYPGIRIGNEWEPVTWSDSH